MASWIRMRLSDLCRDVGTFGEEIFGYPKVKTFQRVPCRASNHQRTTSCGVNIGLTNSATKVKTYLFFFDLVPPRIPTNVAELTSRIMTGNEVYPLLLKFI